MKTPMPHDRFFKASMSDLRVAKAFFEHHLPKAIRAIINLDKLELCKENYIDDRLQLSVTDMLFKVPFKKRAGYLYLLVEHQGRPERLMPFRVAKYNIGIMEQQIKEKGRGCHRLPLIYPMVFYTGKRRYTYSTNIFDLFDGPAELAKELFLTPFQLIDLHRIPDEELKQHSWSDLLELCMKHTLSDDSLIFFENMLSSFQLMEQSDGASYVQSALTYLLFTGKLKDKQQFIDTIRANISPKMGRNIMTVAEEFINEGMQKGMQKGEATLLLRQLQLKFHHIPKKYRQKIASADADTLLTWGERLLNASGLDDIFAPLH